jgi:hypothetical protein
MSSSNKASLDDASKRNQAMKIISETNEALKSETKLKKVGGGSFEKSEERKPIQTQKSDEITPLKRDLLEVPNSIKGYILFIKRSVNALM